MSKCKFNTLTEAVESYLLSHPVCDKQFRNMRCRVASLVKCLGREALADISADDINRWLIGLENSHRAPSTVRGFRTSVVSVLRYARWRPDERDDIRRMKVPAPIVEAWKLDEIRQLLAIAETFEGYLQNGVSRRMFWLTSIHCGYSTALRFGDLEVLPVDKIGPTGVCRLIMRKTLRPVTVRFSDVAQECIRAHGQSVVLPNPHSHNWFCRKFSNLVERAGVRPGSFRWLRRSAASYADAERSGAGRRLLGHTDDGQTFCKNYRDESIVGGIVPEPPSLAVLDVLDEEVEPLATVDALRSVPQSWNFEVTA